MFLLDLVETADCRGLAHDLQEQKKPAVSGRFFYGFRAG